MVVEVAQSSIVPLHFLFTVHHPQAFSVCKQLVQLKEVIVTHSELFLGILQQTLINQYKLQIFPCYLAKTTNIMQTSRTVGIAVLSEQKCFKNAIKNLFIIRIYFQEYFENMLDLHTNFILNAFIMLHYMADSMVLLTW